MARRTTLKLAAGPNTHRGRRRRSQQRTTPLTHPSHSSSVDALAPFAPTAPFTSSALVTSSAPAPRRFSARLASARDRQRLRDRNQEERARVEKMLAATPDSLDTPIDARTGIRADSPLGSPVESGASWGNREALSTYHPPPSLHGLETLGCPVCGSEDLRCDEVVQLGTLRLSECLRCEHLWTQRGPDRFAEVGAPMHRSTQKQNQIQAQNPMKKRGPNRIQKPKRKSLGSTSAQA